MATGTPDIVLPTLVDPMRCSFYPEDATVVFQSAWTGTEQRQRRFYRWHARMEWSLLNRTQAYSVLRFFSRYNAGDSFTIYDPVRQEPNGDVTSVTLNTATGGTGIKVSGGQQTGRALNVKDIPNRATTVCLLRAGDLIGLGTGQMVEVFADFMGTNATTGTIQLSQFLRNAPAADSLIYVSYVPVRMRLLQPVAPDVFDGPAQFGFAVELVEALS